MSTTLFFHVDCPVCVPALVINSQPFHINFGSALANLK